MNQELSVWHLIANASLTVQAVMLLLFMEKRVTPLPEQLFLFRKGLVTNKGELSELRLLKEN